MISVALPIAPVTLLIASAGRKPLCEHVNDPPPSPTTVTEHASYVGNCWRLTAVAEKGHTAAVAKPAGAWLYLGADGFLVAFDGVNTTSGQYTSTATGYDIAWAGTTLLPSHEDATADAGIQTAVSQHVTIVTADHTRLTIRAGEVEARFTRAIPGEK
ncbi:hypothetical protein AB0J80_38405 [Actinoplanes sp. NPDC049548]|uniref:hypothetical protein n=1 Tax=Actinoplanes sp. NPDC049548 TaxID=3155152 RepID=UPI00341A7546